MFHHKKISFFLPIPVFLLMLLSLGVLASVFPANLNNHLVYILLSWVFYFIFSSLDLEILFPLSPVLYFTGFLLLTLPFFLGTITRGSMRWINLGGFTFQPSEIIKPFFVLFSAWYWLKNKFGFKKLLVYGAFFLPVFFLIFFQPDLGSALVVMSVFVGMIFFSDISFKQLLILFLVGVLFLPCSWFLLKDYQKTRVIHFLNPQSDPLGDGYNIIQARIAIGSGGLWGKGFGRGTQGHLSFLPERQTDFIFSSAAEEFGFLGMALLLLLYLILFFKILMVVRISRGKQALLISLGLFFYLSFQTIVNIGMNIGVLPITGITLPFFSYGGSSLLSNMISLGILENIFRSNRKEKMLMIK